MKKKKVSAYARATERMNKETARALCRVNLLDKMYQQMLKKPTKKI